MALPSPAGRARPRPTAALVGLVLLGAAAPPHAHADRAHEVAAGETLSAIARRYGVTLSAIRAASGLSAHTPLLEGQRLTIPDRGLVVVRPGETLARIARNHDTTVEALRAANHLAPDAGLRPGDRIRLPGQDLAAIAPVGRVRRVDSRVESHRPVTFVRVHGKRSRTIRLLRPSGRVAPAALTQLAELMRPRKLARRAKVRRPVARLAKVLAAIAARFPGKPIHVISGFRAAAGYTKRTSRHTHGAAMDLRIPGVALETVRDFCRTLDDVGVGYYPKSRFVHVDVRERPAYWVDWSGPGEAPAYGRGARILAMDSELDAAEQDEANDVVEHEGDDALDDLADGATGQLASDPPSVEPSEEASDPASD